MAQSKKTACSHFGEQAEFFMRIIFFTFWEYDYDTPFFLIIRFVISIEIFLKRLLTRCQQRCIIITLTPCQYIFRRDIYDKRNA